MPDCVITVQTGFCRANFENIQTSQGHGNVSCLPHWSKCPLPACWCTTTLQIYKYVSSNTYCAKVKVIAVLAVCCIRSTALESWLTVELNASENCTRLMRLFFGIISTAVKGKMFQAKTHNDIGCTLHWISVEKGNYKRDNCCLFLIYFVPSTYWKSHPDFWERWSIPFVYWFKPMATKLTMINPFVKI